MLQRSQLVLDDRIRLELAGLAREEGRSISDVAREMLWEKIKEKKARVKRAKKMSAVEAMWEMVKAAKKFTKNDSGPEDLARNYDKYLY